MSSRGLAAVTGFLGGGSSYKALAVGETTWIEVIDNKLSQEEQTKFWKSCNRIFYEIFLLSKFNDALSYIEDIDGILTEDNMSQLRKCYCKYLSLQNLSMKTKGGFLESDFIKYGVDYKFFFADVLRNFNEDGTLKEETEWISTLNSFFEPVNMVCLCGEVGLDNKIHSDNRIHLYCMDNMLGENIDLTPIFKIVYAIAKDIEKTMIGN